MRLSEAEYQSLIASRPVRQRTPVQMVRIQPGKHCARDLSLTVPVPPTTNMAYRVVEGRKAPVMSKIGRQYKNDVAEQARTAALINRWEYPHGARMRLTLWLYFRNNQRRDVSNCVKLLEDSIAAALGFDDKIIDVLHVERKGIDPTNPRCEVSLSVISEG